MDPLEKDQLRRKMANTMRIFTDHTSLVVCVSAHVFDESVLCELCGRIHTQEILVIKNRANKTMKIATQCLTEMIKFQVVDLTDIAKWLEKIELLKVDSQKRKELEEQKRIEERKRLERKVIVRKKAAT